MRYSLIEDYSIDNGPGVRVVLWTQGCPHMCKGCHNPHTWKEDAGRPFTDNDRDYVMEKLDEYLEKDFSVLGGEPLAPYNRDGVNALLGYIKKYRPQTNVWLWTGYLWEEVEHLEVMEHVDVVVDGPFKMQEWEDSLFWKGSRNQRVIDVKETKRAGTIVLMPGDR